MDDIITKASHVLLNNPPHWTSLVQAFPIEVLSLPPASGEWSALECLQHLIDTEPVFQSRVEAFLAGRDFPGFDPDSQGTKPDIGYAPTDLAADYARLRGISLGALARLTPLDLSRQAVHQELGRVTLSEMVHHWAGHDLMHTVQAERALMQPFIQGSGPWVTYYMDHYRPHA